MKKRLLLSCIFILGMIFTSVGRNIESKDSFDKDVGLSKIIKTDVEKTTAILPYDAAYEHTETLVIYPVIEKPVNDLSVKITKRIYLFNCSILQFSSRYGIDRLKE